MNCNIESGMDGGGVGRDFYERLQQSSHSGRRRIYEFVLIAL
jgi:hypothetical protein